MKSYTACELLERIWGQRPFTVLTNWARQHKKRLVALGLKRYIRMTFPPVTRPVHIDHSRCVDNPIECLKCMHACTESIFVCSPTDYRTPDMHEFRFEVRVALPSFCTACGQCVLACPNQAISLQR